MTGYLDLPVGTLRLLTSADIASHIAVGGAADFDGYADFNTAAGKCGIVLSNNSGGLEQANIKLNPPKDRAWLLAKILVQYASIANGISGKATQLTVDGSIIQNLDQNLTVSGTVGSIWGIVSPGTITGTPDAMDSGVFLPIRDTMYISAVLSNGAGGATTLLLSIWVWEYYKTAPLPPPTNPNPAQSVNASWQ